MSVVKALFLKKQKENDYIITPKKSGYRSLHLVYRYDSTQKKAWADMRLALQIRSRLQHAWAAAVETASFFSGEDLKGGSGNPRWLRVFELMGHWMAHEEHCPGLP